VCVCGRGGGVDPGISSSRSIVRDLTYIKVMLISTCYRVAVRGWLAGDDPGVSSAGTGVRASICTTGGKRWDGGNQSVLPSIRPSTHQPFLFHSSFLLRTMVHLNHFLQYNGCNSRCMIAMIGIIKNLFCL